MHCKNVTIKLCDNFTETWSLVFPDFLYLGLPDGLRCRYFVFQMTMWT